jgi:3-hydroxybutyryl-CoA dehydratase
VVLSELPCVDCRGVQTPFSRWSDMSGDEPAGVTKARVRDLPGAVEYHRTISDADVLAFAAATGDDNRVHMDAVYAVEMGMGGRVAHGILVQGLMSTACTRWAEHASLRILSYGWDRVRFIRPVLVGDTISTAYALEDPADSGRKRRATADAWNDRGELVGVGTHILYVVD